MFRRILIALAVGIPILVGALLFFVLYSETALQLAVGQLDRLPLSVNIERVSGRLAGPLDIGRFELSLERIHVVVEEVHADLRPGGLLTGRIWFSDLRARTASVELKPGPDRPDTEPSRLLPGFMRVVVDRLELGNSRFVNLDAAPIEARRLAGSLRIGPYDLDIDDLIVDAAQFGATGRFRLHIRETLGLQLDADLRVPTPHGEPVVAAVDLTGSPADLRLQASMSTPSVVEAKVRVTRPPSGWRITGELQSPAFSLAPWLKDPPVQLRDITLDVQANDAGIQVQGAVTVPEVSARPLNLQANGTYAEGVLVVPSAMIRVADSSTEVSAEGRVVFGEGWPGLNVAAEWQQVQWPLDAAAGEVLVATQQGRLTLAGPLPYQFTLAADVRAAQLPQARINANGELDSDSVVVERYQVAALKGTATGRGTLAFAQPRPWTLSIQAVNIDPTEVHAAFPGTLNFVADGQGSGVSADADFAVAVRTLTGRLRGQPVNARGSLQRDAHGWRAGDVQLALGQNRLTLDGRYGQRIDLRWSFNGRDLTDLVPELSGQLSLNGGAVGARATPHVTAQLQAAQFAWQEWRADTLAADIDVDLQGRNHSRLSVKAGELELAGQKVSSVDLRGEGTADAHRIELEAESTGTAAGAMSTTLALAGAYRRQTWSGQLLDASLDLRDRQRRYDLAQPVPISVAKNDVAVSLLCLVREQSRLCAGGRWQSNGTWNADVSANDIPLDLFSAGLPNKPRYQGRWQAELHASARPGLAWQGKAEVRLTDGAITYQAVGDEMDSVALGDGVVSAVADSERIAASLQLTASEATSVQATARLDRTPGAGLTAMPLTGRIQARSSDADILPIIFPDLDRAQGQLSADIQVAGTLAAPQIDGTAELSQGELDLYRLNLELRGLELAVRLSDNQLRFDGRGRAGEGELTLGGMLAWRDGKPAGTLRFDGNNLLVADLPEYRVVASPDLDFHIDADRIDVTGDIVIPSARIQPTDLSGAVQASPDARLTGQDTLRSQGGFQVASEIRVSLGDDVRIDSFGLQGGLTGSVGTTMKTGSIAVGRGELSVTEGRYEAFGQKLAIERGRLLFDSSPLDDPGLDIQAERELEDVTVGVYVRGVLRSPRMQLYSEPSMTQAEIMSYLIIGKPMDELQNQDAATVSSAREAIAYQGGGLLASQIGRRIGIEEVGVETTGASGTALVLGKFLSPRLYVSYGISLTEAINTFKMRYTLSDRWIFKTESGEHQSADLEFEIER